MDIFSSKFSLYDILAMVIPGGTFLLFLHILFLSVPSYPTNIISDGMHNFWDVFYGAIIIVLAYIVGIVNHLLSSKIWAQLRNNPKLIETNFNNVLHTLPKKNNLGLLYKSEKQDNEKNDGGVFKEYLLGSFWMLFSLFIVSQFFQMTSTLWKSCKCSVFMLNIDFLLIALLVVLSLTFVFFYQRKEDNVLLDAYYEADYFVLQNNKNRDISIIEGQVAFLQSMFLPLSLFLSLSTESLAKVFPMVKDTAPCYAAFLLKVPLAVLWLCILPAVISRINKIHRRVWEDYGYLKRLEKK